MNLERTWVKAMNKKRIAVFSSKYGVQLVFIVCIIAVLLIVSLSLINRVMNSDLLVIKDNFIFTLLGNCIIGGAFYSFSTTNRLLKFKTAFGITRKKIFNDYILRIIQVFFWLGGMYLFYTITDMVLLKEFENVVSKIFDIRVLFLFAIFVFVNMIGFLSGIRQVKTWIYMLALLFVFIVAYLVFIFGVYNFIVLGGLVVANVILLLINYKIIMKEEIR